MELGQACFLSIYYNIFSVIFIHSLHASLPLAVKNRGKKGVIEKKTFGSDLSERQILDHLFSTSNI